MKKTFLILFLFLVPVLMAHACSTPVKISEIDGVYHIVLDGKALRDKIRFVSSDKLITNKQAHKLFNSILTINTGYFDPKNQKTISYIVEDGKVLSPLDNENLLNNPVLAKNMDKIESRTEFRVLECGRRTRYEIVSHTAGVSDGCRIKTSAQGGPMVLPELRLEEEFFVVKNEQGKVVRESASVLHRCARTIIGLKGEDIHILIFTNKHPVNMYEVQKYCLDIGLERAMGFDGGSSTSMNYDDIEVVSANDYGRLLKSFMIIER